MEKELWKSVPNYEEIYEISNFGRLRNIKKDCIVKGSKNKDNYIVVGLYKNKQQKTFMIHQLVAMAFLEHKPDGLKKVVDHIDNNQLNNNLDNLQIITHRQNVTKDKTKTYSDLEYITFDKKLNKWKSSIFYNKRRVHLGYFNDENLAHNAYLKAKNELDNNQNLDILYPLNKKRSQYKGVSWHEGNNRWISRFKGKCLGYFKTEEEAFQAYNNAKNI
jgi:hypothetical protein